MTQPLTPSPPHPGPYDPELAQVMAASELPDTVTLDMIEQVRAGTSTPPIEYILAGRAIDHEQPAIPTVAGGLTISVLPPRDQTEPRASVRCLHGGGVLMGDRFTFIDATLGWVQQLGAIVEYRRAPEHPDPAPLDDAYAGLRWLSKQHAALRIDASRLLVAGFAAGTGLAAGWRCGRGTRPDRPNSGSCWAARCSMTANDTGWTALLGARRGTSAVSAYAAAPARANDLAGFRRHSSTSARRRFPRRRRRVRRQTGGRRSAGRTACLARKLPRFRCRRPNPAKVSGAHRSSHFPIPTQEDQLVKILKTFARMFVADLDESLPLYERLVGQPADMRIPFEDAELASVGDFLLIAGTAEATDRYRDTIGPVIVDDIDDTEKTLTSIGATTDRYSAPTGEGSYIRHPDGVVIEYLQWNTEMMNRVFGHPADPDTT